VTAEEIVSGVFRDLSGTVASLDPAAGTLTVKDVQTRKNFVVKVVSESRLLQLPAPMAERIAQRLKAARSGSTAAAPAGGNAAPAMSPAQPSAAPEGQHQFNVLAGSSHPPDFQQMLAHLPAIQLTDLHPGDAVMVLTTQGNSDHVTAVTLLSGVDAILRAAPDSSQAMNLGSWSLGSSGAEGAAP